MRNPKPKMSTVVGTTKDEASRYVSRAVGLHKQFPPNKISYSLNIFSSGFIYRFGGVKM